MSAAENLTWLADLPEGWAQLYETLIADLEQLDPTLCVVQAKQKFGTLRVYLAQGSPAAFERIDVASRESASACENCGATGHLYNTRGHYQTLCEGHTPDGAVLVDSSDLPYVSFRLVDGKIRRVDR